MCVYYPVRYARLVFQSVLFSGLLISQSVLFPGLFWFRFIWFPVYLFPGPFWFPVCFVSVHPDSAEKIPDSIFDRLNIVVRVIGNLEHTGQIIVLVKSKAHLVPRRSAMF